MIAILGAGVGKPRLEEIRGRDVDHELGVTQPAAKHLFTRLVTRTASGDAAEHALSKRRGVGRVEKGAQLAHGVLHAIESAAKRSLHDLQRQGASAKPRLLVPMLEHHRVFAGHVATARLPISHVESGHDLQLERDVLDDMGSVGPAREPLKEAAPLANAAAMLDQPWHRVAQ